MGVQKIIMGRPDGKYIKNINPYTKIMPHLMPNRDDSMNMSFVDVRCEPLDAFIAEQAALGKDYSYIDIMMTALIRLFARRPALNRFVMNRKIYQHNDIAVSFVVKKKMVDNSEDTTVKLHFDGSENIDDMHEAILKIVSENRGSVYNSVDKTAEILTKIPHWVIKMAIGIIKFADKHNILPKKIVEISPFHNSFFITFMKSIKGDAIFHHCYNFGTTGLFFALGKEKLTPVVEGGEIKVGKVMQVGVVMDERFCDGLYFVNSCRLLKIMLHNPKSLMERYDLGSEQHAVASVRTEEDKAKYKELARVHEEQKKARKLAEKQAKKEAKEAAKKNKQ